MVADDRPFVLGGRSSTELSVSDVKRLMDVVTRHAEKTGGTPSDVIDWFEAMVAEGNPPSRYSRGRLARFIERWRRIRVRRNEFIGLHLFRDPAWDMLLELYSAHELGRPQSISALCHASGVPPTTALRHLQRLEQLGVITRTGDPNDQRRLYVRPTPKALDAVANAATSLLDIALEVAGVTRHAERRD